MIWGGGAVLALLIYAVGPDRFLDVLFNLYDWIDVAVRNLALMLGAQAYSLARALVIAFYLVFCVLAFLCAQRRLGGIGAWVVLTIVLALLVWRPYDPPAPLSHWAVSFVLILAAAVTMTHRLTSLGRTGLRPPFYPPPPNGSAGP